MPPSSNQKFSGIFVSYRRDDSSGHAGRLADRLVDHFGRNRIFVDIDTIEPGEDFVAVIENAVASCEILIAVIGQNWLSPSGSGRLDNPHDFVRLEIATALRRDIRVIPVLVQRASMPKPKDLPEDLARLTRRNAVELSDSRWQSDVDQLISVMERVLAKRAEVEQLSEANRPNVDAESKAEKKETAEARVGEAPVPELDFAARQNGLAESATIVTEETASPFYKRRLMLGGGAFLIVLLAATILIWASQTGQNTSGNTDQSPTPQPSLVTQSSPAKSTPTPELKPSPSPESPPFAEPTLWKRKDTDTVLQIVRIGNTLSALMNTPSETAAAAGRGAGDLAFKGSYEGRTIKGTAYIRFSEEAVNRCPEFKGEQAADLELTLSADGNTLSGSRADFKLSDECTIITLRRKKLTYTRVSG